MPNQFGHVRPQAQCFANYFANLLNEQELADFKIWMKDYNTGADVLNKMPDRQELKKSFETLDALDVEAACAELRKKLFSGERRYLWAVRSRLFHLAAAILGLVLTSVLIFVSQRRGATEKTNKTARGVYLSPGTIKQGDGNHNACSVDHKVIMTSEGAVTIFSSSDCAIVVDTEAGVLRFVSKSFNEPVSIIQTQLPAPTTEYIKYSGIKPPDQRIGMIAAMAFRR